MESSTSIQTTRVGHQSLPEKKEISKPNDIQTYEQVAIKMPKTIIEILRKTDINEGPAAWIKNQIREDVKAALDVAQPELWIKAFQPLALL